ncbi:M1 family metallopeptidase [Roseofilum casamattae]|uniref:Aminopeptidase N n=1 Tax=Roseofilum casamattae BLCC-M143 TaxID=3022442 RepID=A0ABT7BQV6_9CYAN|nr:M1 family metallopeptidase [Roseofilum casamattae]MDJ1181570.1 M1 family metallopeptidase [Roseofilum casamattae BLCC-M143]
MSELLNSFLDTEKPKRKSFELPGSYPHYTPDRPGQVQHISLDLELNIPNRSYTGVCQIRLNPIRSGIATLSLDAVDLNIDEVRVNNRHQTFNYDGEVLQIQLNPMTERDSPLEIRVSYRVQDPQRGLYFITPDENTPDKPTQVWTQGEDEDSRYWFPCFDYPGQLSTSEIRVKVPSKMMAISNGELIETKRAGKYAIYHWFQKEIHPTYLIALAVGEFAEIKDEWKGKSVTYYVEKSREVDARRTMGKTPKMIEFFSQAFGYDYAYPKYAQVCVADFIFGGMENTSTTLLTDRCLLDERSLLDRPRTESLVAHELAHQWFGDLVVIKHWSHAWIKEGMASYSEVLWTEHEYGLEDGAYYYLQEARNYLQEDKSRYRRPIVTHIYREPIELYDAHLYEKGACVYHMIRAELGEDLFATAVRTFVRDNAHKTVETVDLLRSIEKATGHNLQFLFDQYVYRGGHPDFKVSYSWDEENQLAKVTVIQTQAKDDKKLLFDLNIPIGFGYCTAISSNGKNAEKEAPEVSVQSFSVRIHQAEESFYFPLESKPEFVSFDRGNYYLKTVELDYPFPELSAQLQYDPDPISRTYAIAALVKKGDLKVVKLLGKALQAESFWGVRVEIAKGLGKINLDRAFDALLLGLKDKNARVRKAVVEALGNIKTKASYKTLKTLLDRGDPSYQVEAAAARGIGAIAAIGDTTKSKNRKAIKLLKSVLETRAGWNEVVRSGAIGGLSQMNRSEDALNLVLDYTKPKVPQPLRLNAIRALGSAVSGQSEANIERVLARLDSLSRETFFLTQMATIQALGRMKVGKAAMILGAIASSTSDGRVRRRAEEAMQRVRKSIGSKDAIASLQQEVQDLQKENRKLFSRLEALEAKSKK